jgi:monofunctional biosynthetic peptidoglycan transglycosylase
MIAHASSTGEQACAQAALVALVDAAAASGRAGVGLAGFAAAGCRSAILGVHGRAPDVGVGKRRLDMGRRLRLARPGRALVAAEDQNFPIHNGFDLKAIEKARASNARGHKVRGASTISQQVAKNLFLWSGRSWVRKGIEAWYTVLIEAFWPKHRILEMYTNIAEFGDGVYGAQAASRRFFGKDASQLTPAQSARLAAVLPSPRRYDAGRPGPYVQRRSNGIQRQMRHIGPGAGVP